MTPQKSVNQEGYTVSRGTQEPSQETIETQVSTYMSEETGRQRSVDGTFHVRTVLGREDSCHVYRCRCDYLGVFGAGKHAGTTGRCPQVGGWVWTRGQDKPGERLKQLL